MQTKTVTAAELRSMVADAIASTIETHRSSRSSRDDAGYIQPSGPPTDDEIDDFLFHNPLLGEETVDQLSDPGLLGFFAKTANATLEWLEEFRGHLNAWAENQSWLAADEAWREWTVVEPAESEIWTPASEQRPAWFPSESPSLMLALDLIRSGKHLSDMHWRKFEELIAELLAAEKWEVILTGHSRDGGLDVLATRRDPVLGEIRAVWQAKKYGPQNKVRLSEVRELSAIREDQRATKALVVTTSRLTRDAIAWVKRDTYRLGYKEHDDMLRWIRGTVLGQVD